MRSVPQLAPLAVGAKFADRYRIDRVLGAGGMGVVYEVRDRDAVRALKVLHQAARQDAPSTRRLLREARAARAIDSPHVARVHEVGIDDDSQLPYLVLDRAAGIELAQLLAERGALSPSEALALVEQVALALDAAHRVGVVHRDVKPSNVLIDHRQGRFFVTVIDFGLAKLIEATLSGPLTEGLAGTPVYMAPEQIEDGGTVGFPTDVYALGQLTYRMLVGEPYFAEVEEAAGILRLLAAIMAGPTEVASERARRRRGVALPVGFDGWFARVASPDPRRRPASASAAVDELREALGVGGAEGNRASLVPPSEVGRLGPPMVGPGWRLPAGAGLLLALALALYWLSGRWL